MKKLLLPSFLLISIFSFGQTEFYDCPILSEYEFVNDAKLFRPMYSSNGRDSFFIPAKIELGENTLLKYEQYFDCSGTGHLGVIARFIWAIPTNLTSFEIVFSDLDSTELPLTYTTSGGGVVRRSLGFHMTKGRGEIRGQLVKGQWHVTGTVKVEMINPFSNSTDVRNINVNGTYKLHKKTKKKKYPPIFFF